MPNEGRISSDLVLPHSYGRGRRDIRQRIRTHVKLKITHSRSWAILDKLPIVPPLKNFPALYGTRRFITALTRALHWSLSWVRLIQSIPSYPISLRSILILSTHLRVGLPSGLFPSGFPTNILYTHNADVFRAVKTILCSNTIRYENCPSITLVADWFVGYTEHFSFSSALPYDTHYVASNCRMVDEWLIGKDVEGRSQGLRYYPGICPEDLSKIRKNLCQNSRYPGQYSNRTPPKYKSRAEQVDQVVS
jgi:hypothetical protein